MLLPCHSTSGLSERFLILQLFEEIFEGNLLNEVLQMEIINRITLSSILELLLWLTSKVCTYFCNIKMFKKIIDFM